MRTPPLAAIALVCLPLLLRAQATPLVAPGPQLDIADQFMAQARFREALDAYRQAVSAAGTDAALVRRARSGLTLALLRTGEFSGARDEARQLVQSGDGDARVLALYGDTLWATGMFDEAEQSYGRALRADAGEARAHNGRARSLAARSRLDEALAEARQALAIDPGEAEFHHTAGVIYERQHRFDEAAAAFLEYVNRLPNKDRSEQALWTRAEIKFLTSFKGRKPIDFGDTPDATWTVPFRIVKDKVLISVKVNRQGSSDFVLDTGAEQTVVSRDLARRRDVVPITYMQSAGVGDVGLRGLQIGRIDSLQVGDLTVRNVPCVIKNPPLGELRGREPDSFSPIALGLSMRIDYVRKQLVMARALPEARYETELPLRLYRLATVRGIVNGQPVTFVVDTGGEVLSISQAIAGQVADLSAFRRIPLKVYGTSGWDKSAFLLPNVDLAFESIRFSKIPVVVLNLRAPSALLGFELGGIVGHKFLSQYRVSIDLARSVVGLDTAN